MVWVLGFWVWACSHPRCWVVIGGSNFTEVLMLLSSNRDKEFWLATAVLRVTPLLKQRP